MNTDLSAQLSTNYNNFEELISAGKIYVDKTPHIHRMLKQSKNYFLSRPRRFGKSLLISTLQALFEAKKELFKNTHIANTDYDWQPYPVIKLDMSSIDDQTPEIFEKSLVEVLSDLAKKCGCPIHTDSHQVKKSFSDLITQLADTHKKPVVVLIDEYDAPILNSIQNLDQAKQIRETLKSFYSILKSQNHNIKFLFITGITKFSHVSIFSGLNNLKDLSMKKEYADLLGYTQDELEQFFSAHINALAQHNRCSSSAALQQIREWYNGYRFSRQETYVYNPYSTLNLFDEQEFLNYWFTSGTPSFLADWLTQETRWRTQDFDEKEVNSLAFETFDLNNLDLTGLLIQTGYLTIKNYSPEFGGIYTVGYPNKEVYESFMRSLMQGLSCVSFNETSGLVFQMLRSLLDEKLESYLASVKMFFKQVPYEAYLELERDFQNILFTLHTLLGFDTQMEVHTNKGRMDAIVQSPKSIYIFEYKVNQTAQEALNQIKHKTYYEPYENTGKKIVLIGINFSKIERNIDDVIIEEWESPNS